MTEMSIMTIMEHKYLHPYIQLKK